MLQPTSISAVAPDAGAGLSLWMERVVQRAAKAAEDLEQDSVHDLRVALRRCRTMSEALCEVNPDPGWRRIKKSTRNVFHALGDLRDTQVEREWVKKLAPGKDPLRRRLVRMLSAREKERKESARKALEDFGLKEWKKLSRKLTLKADFFPTDSIVYQRIALARLQETVDLFHRARRNRSAASWHRARIGLKHFRYLAENFLPRRYAPWSADIKHLQDLLGEVHDLDVLRSDLRRVRTNAAGSVASLFERLQTERKVRLAEVVAKTTGSQSVFGIWRSGLEIAHSISPVPLAKLKTA
jgi:CHAD domain-containing protein